MESKHKKLIGLGITGTAVLSIALAVAITSRNGLLNIHNAKGTAEPKSVTLSNADLKEVILEDFDIPDNRGTGAPETKHDKKFRIPLPNGKYIIGAIVYHDCGYQYIGTKDEANASLGDAITLDNVSTPGDTHGQNAFNFHIIFALDNIDSISYGFDVAVTDYNVEKTNGAYFTAIKLRQYSNPDNTDAYFYSDITTKGYKGVVDNIDGSTTYFDNEAQAKTTEQDAYYNQVTYNDWQKSNIVNKNMVAIQFNYAGRMFAAEKVISFTFKTITFNYHCN